MRSGDLRGALSCARDATALLGEHDREDDAYVCLACAEIEHAAGDVAAARERIRDARDRLLESAAKIGSTVAREHYLSHVPEHARTLALAGEWLGV